MSTTTLFVRTTALSIALGAAIAMSTKTGGAADAPPAGKDSPAPPDSVVILIGNRLFPDFREIVSTGLHERRQIGDTDFFFEVAEFFPHFAIMDSTRRVVSLSDEPKNPAFRIRVYESEAAVDSTWAFFNMNVPHFSRNAALWFQVLAFDYRGTVFQKEAPPAEPPVKAPHATPGKAEKKP